VLPTRLPVVVDVELDGCGKLRVSALTSPPGILSFTTGFAGASTSASLDALLLVSSGVVMAITTGGSSRSARTLTALSAFVCSSSSDRTVLWTLGMIHSP
jgi:hypothetical protein